MADSRPVVGTARGAGRRYCDISARRACDVCLCGRHASIIPLREMQNCTDASSPRAMGSGDDAIRRTRVPLDVS